MVVCRSRTGRNCFSHFLSRSLIICTVRRGGGGDLGRSHCFPEDVKNSRGDLRLCRLFGPGICHSGVSAWQRARLKESVSVPQDRYQKLAICTLRSVLESVLDDCSRDWGSQKHHGISDHIPESIRRSNSKPSSEPFWDIVELYQLLLRCLLRLKAF